MDNGKRALIAPLDEVLNFFSTRPPMALAPPQ
jgi:hypothetical protein